MAEDTHIKINNCQLTPSKLSIDNSGAMKRKYDNIESNQFIIDTLNEKLAQEKQNNEYLKKELSEMRNQLGDLTKTISNLNETINKLQSHNKKLLKSIQKKMKQNKKTKKHTKHIRTRKV